MLTILSPAKTLDFSPQARTSKFSQPELLDDAEILVRKLRGMSRRALGRLMGISPELSELNQTRYADWTRPFTPQNAKPAVLAFNGEVYMGLEAARFRAKDFAFAQGHLRILSGLYGVLRPLDLIQPYRLEMGTRLATRRGKSLYDFWGEKVADSLSQALAGHDHPVLINLASREYFRAVRPRSFEVPVVTPLFREIKGGRSRVIASFAKRARGRMAAWIVHNRFEHPDQLRGFDADGYEFVAEDSTAAEPVFARPQPPPVRG